MTAARRARFDIRESAPQILAVIGLVFVANLVFALAWVRPQLRAQRTLDEDHATRAHRVAAREREVQAIEGYLAGLRKAGDDLVHLRDEVLSTRERKLIASHLEIARIAREFGINVERIQYENEVFESERLDRMGMVIPLEGGYVNLRKFLRAVESSERFFVVERVALAQGADGGSLLQLNITLATYFNLPAIEDADGPAGETRVRRRA